MSQISYNYNYYMCLIKSIYEISYTASYIKQSSPTPKQTLGTINSTKINIQSKLRKNELKGMRSVADNTS